MRKGKKKENQYRLKANGRKRSGVIIEGKAWRWFEKKQGGRGGGKRIFGRVVSLMRKGGWGRRKGGGALTRKKISLLLLYTGNWNRKDLKVGVPANWEQGKKWANKILHRQTWKTERKTSKLIWAIGIRERAKTGFLWVLRLKRDRKGEIDLMGSEKKREKNQTKGHSGWVEAFQWVGKWEIGGTFRNKKKICGGVLGIYRKEARVTLTVQK